MRRRQLSPEVPCHPPYSLGQRTVADVSRSPFFYAPRRPGEQWKKLPLAPAGAPGIAVFSTLGACPAPPHRLALRRPARCRPARYHAARRRLAAFEPDPQVVDVPLHLAGDVGCAPAQAHGRYLHAPRRCLSGALLDVGAELPGGPFNVPDQRGESLSGSCGHGVLLCVGCAGSTTSASGGQAGRRSPLSVIRCRSQNGERKTENGQRPLSQEGVLRCPSSVVGSQTENGKGGSDEELSHPCSVATV